ncbi:protocadherin Fat 4-like isoform X2 [Dendropsophus ebraccatus]|uniref:protocadherin Fat 4-like isoform X2 n=1 Tax=Dendropsophus ebraccatus TaxID=150705 RepID=UPI0038313EA0
MLRPLLHYLLLCFVALNLFARGGKNNWKIKDLDDGGLKHDGMLKDSAISTTKPVNAHKLKIPSVKDKPDRMPVFVHSYSYRASVPETYELNTLILKVEARETHTSLKYSLSGPGSDYFHINPLNGEITLAKHLEYNKINRFNLIVNAEDSMGFSSSVPVLIDIRDVDTMDPHFIFPLYEGSISENKRGILSMHPEEIKAVDGDLGINETVYYSISKVYPPQFRDVISIDRFKGTISLNKEIDRETVSLLTVQIKAVQQNNYLKKAYSMVRITILDENDNRPQFSQSIYETFLPEDSPPGSRILVLSASDKDQDGLSNGHFSTNNTMFSVDKNGLMYFINGKLDRELAPIIHVQVFVFDAASGGRNSSAEVIINITDVNDNNPQFHNLPLHYMVPEGDYTENNPLLVATLNVTDSDTGLNGNVTITAHAEDGDQSFNVQNGNIFVSRPLDREMKDKYVLFLIASDKGSPPRQSFADAVIVVEDVNDHVPTFTKEEYSAELILNKVKAGDMIISVSATDLDIGNNSLISYRFAQAHSGFSINKENGDIFLTSDVSAHTMGTNIVIPVIATDHGAPALSSTATVIVKVSEGQTEFVNSNYSFSVPEGMPEGSDVGAIQLTTGPDVSVTYIVQTYPDVFSITEKGTIITRAILDREEQDSYDLLVTAVDSQDPPNTAAALITISVIDVNDNSPVFPPLLKSNVTCLENKTFVDLANIVAADPDTGNNSAVTYSLENDFDGTFRINSVTGELLNVKPLDADKTDSYDIKVIAQDSGIPPLSSTALIHVTVQDVDDNKPVFKRNIYNITIKENEPPHVILNVSAEDSDIWPNAVIFYSFIEVSDLFYIGEESGCISNLKPLDFETSTEHVLTVIAQSPRNPHVENTATVIVKVEDVNEEGPIVEYPVYHTVIWDGEFQTGSIIFDVNAKKPNTDMDEGIHYSISGDSSEKLFSIANGTGHIFLTKDLPMHGSPEYYTFTVTCTDSGAPPQSTSVKVFVAISPSNVTAPVFSSDFYNPEPLNTWTASHTYVIQIKAFYVHSSLIYSIEDKKNEDYYVLDSESGIMRTKTFLKIEDFPSNVTVRATDSQKPWIYSEAIVHVTVKNDNQYAPVFKKSLEKVTVKEGQSVPTLIAQVQAMDKDPGTNGILTYSLLNNHSTSFTIDATNGKVFAAISFDFENGSHEFQVFICAEDEGMPHRKQGYLTLIVQILDVNDWEPMFSLYSPMYVEESAPVGTVVGQITATDEDSGDNAFIVYSLLDDNDQFDIDKLLGNIIVKRHLDREMKEKSMLTVTAHNNMTAPFYQTSTNLTVFVLDTNDNPPEFAQKTYFAELDVNSPVGSFVITVNATDADEGNNGDVEYSLLSGLSSTDFMFENIRNGKIITATNHLEPGKVTLSAIAKDRGSPSLSSMASVIVNVVNNKTSSAFSPNEVSTVLREDQLKDEPIFTFSAENAKGKNLTYRIVAGNDKGQFYLDEKTGKLWTTENFDKDVQPSYTITVEVDTQPNIQGPLPPNMAQLKITVLNFKEGPVFDKETYTSTIINTVTPGRPVIKVKARSRDPSTKPTFTYSLVDELGGEFAIDNHTGQIVASNLAGKTGTFQFKAKATDENGLSAQTVIQIQVKSPSTSREVEMKINQTSDDVKRQIPKITRALENVLKDKVTKISLESDASNKQVTEIKFEVPGKSNQDIVRKLTDNLPSLQKQLDSIFGKPTSLTIPQPHGFALSPTDIGVLTIVTLLVVVMAASAFFLTRKRSQNGSKKASSDVSGKIHPAGGDDRPSDNGLKKDNGDKKPDIDGGQDGVPKFSDAPSKNEIQTCITVEENTSTAEADKEPLEQQVDQTVTDPQEPAEQGTSLDEDRDKNPDTDQYEISKLSGTDSENGRHHNISGEENKESTDKADKETPEQQMDQTVADTQEPTEPSTSLPKDWKTSQKRSRRSNNEIFDRIHLASGGEGESSGIPKKDDITAEVDMEPPEQQMDQTVTDTQEPTEMNILPEEDSTVDADKEPPEPQMDQIVTDTQEPTELTILPEEDSPVTADEETEVVISETVTYIVEPSDDNGEIIREIITTEEDIIKDGQELKIVEEKEIDYVETWESYETTEDSEKESSQQEIPDDPDVVIIQESERPEGDGNEIVTCAGKILDDE